MKTAKLYSTPLAAVEQVEPAQPPEGVPRAWGKPGGVLAVVEGLASRERKPLETGAGQRLRRTLEEAVQAPLAFDAVLRDGRSQADSTHQQWLLNTIRKVQPTQILAFGQTAHTALLGRAIPAFNNRKCYGWLSNGTPVHLLPRHSAPQLSNPIYRQWFREDLRWALSGELPVPPMHHAEARWVTTEAEARAAVDELLGHPEWVYDTETFGPQFSDRFKIVVLAANWPGADYAYIWPEDALQAGDPRREQLVRLLDHPACGHNLKYDVLAAWLHLGRPPKLGRDTRLMSKLAQANGPGGLAPLAERVGMGGHKHEAEQALATTVNVLTRLRTACWKEVPTDKREEYYTTSNGQRRKRTVVVSSRPATVQDALDRLSKEWVKQRTSKGQKTTFAGLFSLEQPSDDWKAAVLYTEDPPKSYAYGLMDRDTAERYCGLDVVSTGHLAPLAEASLPPGPRMVWDEVMSRATYALSRIEHAGIAVDLDALGELERALDARMAEVQPVLDKYAPHGMNWNSTPQKQALLFGKPEDGGLGLPVVGKTDTGAPSTDATALSKLKGKHEVIDAIRVYTECAKLQSNYARGLRPHVRRDGRVHCTFNADGAESGRMSCLAAGEPVTTQRGEVPVEHVRVGDTVWTHRGRWRRVVAHWSVGVREVYGVRLCTGDVLRCTGSHRLLASNGQWEHVEDAYRDRFQKVQRRQIAAPVLALPNPVVRPPRGGGEGSWHLRVATPSRGAPQQGAGFAVAAVEAVYPDGSARVYDLTVEEDESYAARGVFSHNCSNPNLQTIPSRSLEWAKRVKNVFVAPPGRKLVFIDYATLELRVMAMLSGEQTMIDAFDAGLDLHRQTAIDISHLLWGNDFESCGLGYDEVVLKADGAAPDDPRWEQLRQLQAYRRKIAKAVNFGTAYGQGPAAMAEQWGIPEADAAKAQEAIMGRRRKLRAWIKRTQQECRQRGFTETWWNGQPARRRPLPDIASNIRDMASHAERAAYNTPVQGTGSEFCMASIGEIAQWIEDDGIDAQLVLTVHDSIGAEVDDEDVPEYVHHATRIMTGWYSMGVPITVDVEVGQRWGEMQPYTPGAQG